MQEESRQMILHLYQAIPYLFCKTQPVVSDIAAIYAVLLHMLDEAPVGSEACLRCEYERSEDGIRFSVRQTGWANPPDETMRRAVSEGAIQPTPATAETAFVIPAADYRFTQLPWTPEGSSLVMALLPFFATPAEIHDAEGTFFLRMIKENMLEVVVQLLAPLAAK